jgi:hypothetical protein
MPPQLLLMERVLLVILLLLLPLLLVSHVGMQMIAAVSKTHHDAKIAVLPVTQEEHE